MSSRILLIEDEPGLVLTLSDLLGGEGYEVEAAMDGPSGIAKAVSGGHDLIILDVGLPGLNGFDLCRQVRKRGIDIPILMLTAHGGITDRVAGLKLGADDYLVKPFDPTELLARLEALLRRIRKEPAEPAAHFAFGGVSADFESGIVIKNGSRIELAGKELQLLRYFVQNRGKVLSRDELLKEVWQYQPSITSRTVDVHIVWLRQKLEENPQMPRHFHTVRGVGYRFAP